MDPKVCQCGHRDRLQPAVVFDRIVDSVAGLPNPVRLPKRVDTSEGVFVSGVEAAWRAFSGAIREKCRRVLGDTDEAEDAMQETFIRLWKVEARHQPRQTLAWLYRTATHLSVDRLRQRAVHQRGVPQSMQAGDLHRATENRQLVERLAHITDTDALEAAVLARLDGLTQSEVAEVLNVSERTVRRLLDRFDDAAAQLVDKEFS